MGRTSKKTEAVNIEEQTVGTVQEEQVSQESHITEQVPEQALNKSEKKEEISPRVADLMRLYPHYEELWITTNGFVHPVGTPKYLLKDAILYRNKFYNK